VFVSYTIRTWTCYVQAPAENAVRVVITHATQIVKFFRASDHKNGSAYLARLGGSGGDSCPAVVACMFVGCGSSVSKVRYLQTISPCMSLFPGRELMVLMSLSCSLMSSDAGSKLLRLSSSSVAEAIIPGPSISLDPRCGSISVLVAISLGEALPLQS
jgi:hypothetical protein